MFAHNFDRNLVAENKRVYYAGFIRVTGPVHKMRYDAGRYGTGLALRVTRVGRSLVPAGSRFTKRHGGHGVCSTAWDHKQFFTLSL